MQGIIKKQACLLLLLFISITAYAYGGNDLKPVKVRREIKQECRKQEGACSSYRIKDFKKTDKFKTSRKRFSR